MNYVKDFIYGPDPKEAFRKSKQLTRRNIRQLDREIDNVTTLGKKTETLIKQCLKKKEIKNSKIYARELIRIQKQKQRLCVSRAQLASINMQLDEQQQQLKLTNKLSQSTTILKDVNSLIKIPQISKSVRDLSQELTKSGIITEMVDDSFDLMDDEIDEDDSDLEDEVTQILNGFATSTAAEPQAAVVPVTAPSVPDTVQQDTVQETEEEDEHEVNLMRERLKALQS